MMIHMNRTASTLLVSLFVLLGGCSRGESERLVITGSSTVAPLINEIAKRYEQQHPGLRIDVQTGGSSRGINDARQGLAQIGMSSRALKPEEAAVLDAHVIATDGLGFLVHASNPVRELSAAQITAIYRGELQNWRDVGGADQPITVISRADGRAELEQFQAIFGLPATEIVADLLSGETLHSLHSVAGDPQALVYLSVGAAEFEIQQGRPVRLLSYAGVPASRATVASGDYPLQRPLILVTAPSPSPRTRDFIAYARSPAVHDLVARQAYVPVAP